MVFSLPVLTAKYILDGWDVIEETDTVVTLKKTVRFKRRLLAFTLLSLWVSLVIVWWLGLVTLIGSLILLRRWWRQESRQRVQLIVQADGSVDRLELFA